MAITAKVVCDSISPTGIRLTTLQLRYPRMVHADFMTHRVFSRNGRSSRAVPVTTLLLEDPYLPHFKKNKGGMVATEEFSERELATINSIWLQLARDTKYAVRQLAELGVHKQWANRPLEWFGYIDVLVTSTDWSNFFALRQDGGAQPEIIELADAIHLCLEHHEPFPLAPGEWHLPYIMPEDVKAALVFVGHHDHNELEAIEVLKKISVARCARLTIKPFDGNGSYEKELERYKLLMVSRPVHASPAEHIATPDIKRWNNEYTDEYWDNPEQHGNYFGWRQFRKMIPYNTVEDR